MFMVPPWNEELSGIEEDQRLKKSLEGYLQ
jgi:hypothetical protein